MTTRDTLEQLLELHDEVQRLDEMIRKMFNRVCADHLKRMKEGDSEND